MVRSASSRSFCPFQRRTLMHGDVVGLVALDFILWLILACVVNVPFVINIFGVHLDDRPGDVSSLRVPGHVIADLECSLHEGSPRIALSNSTSRRPSRSPNDGHCHFLESRAGRSRGPCLRPRQADSLRRLAPTAYARAVWLARGAQHRTSRQTGCRGSCTSPSCRSACPSQGSTPCGYRCHRRRTDVRPHSPRSPWFPRRRKHASARRRHPSNDRVVLA